MVRSGPRQDRKGAPQQPLEAALESTAADPVRRALWLDAMDQRLHPHLPPALAPHCRLANVVGGQLVFLVDSPVWKAKLRLSTDALLEAARSVGLSATGVTVKMSTAPLDPPGWAAKTVNPLSATAQAALLSAIAALHDDDSATP